MSGLFEEALPQLIEQIVDELDGTVLGTGTSAPAGTQAVCVGLYNVKTTTPYISVGGRTYRSYNFVTYADGTYAAVAIAKANPGETIGTFGSAAYGTVNARIWMG